MSITAWLSDLLIGVAAQPWLLVPLIILATFVLEDVATVAVAVLASRMLIPAEYALVAAVVGTYLGDVALYAAARWATTWRMVRGWLSRPALGPALSLMRRYSVPVVILARFIPGTRLPVFTAAGAAGMPTFSFVGLTFVTTLLWTPGLYLAAAGLDMRAAAAGPIGFAGAAALLLLAIILPKLVAHAADARAA